MSFLETYNKYIIEKIMLEFLYSGIIPTSEDIEEKLIEYKEKHKDLSLPRSKYLETNIQKGASSSASLMSEIREVFSSDFSVLTREIYNIGKTSIKNHERWQDEISRISSKSKKIEEMATNLLILKRESLGYYSFVGDIFTDLNLVDTSNTKALVDIQEQKVSINHGSEYSSSVAQINTNDLTDKNIQFSPLSKRSGTSYTQISSENSLLEVLNSLYSSWIGQVSCPSSGQMTAELKVDLFKEVELSCVRLEGKRLASNTKETITLQYSSDGYSWFLVPTEESTQYLYSFSSWNFKKINARWIKIIFNKTTHDDYYDGKYKYNFYLRSLKLFNNNYFDKDQSYFYSSALYAEDKSNKKIGFSKVKFESCEDIPTNTSIDYFLSASKDASSWTDWHQVSPGSRKNALFPKIINFSGASTLSTLDSEDTFFSGIENTKITREFDLEDTELSVLRNNKIGVINCPIQLDSSFNIKEVSNSITVWRNLKTDTVTVRNNSKGWNLSGQIYSCYFQIKNPSGIIFDFGDRECVLDGKLISGVRKISEGVHKFETVSDNWADIGIGSASSEEELSDLDPLYPYNHKLLIEGYDYTSGFKGDKKYTGVDFFTEKRLQRISYFDLENNKNSLDYFAIKNVSSSTSPILAIFIYFDSSFSDYQNEDFFIQWNTDNTEEETFKYIKLKAKLNSEEESVSPSFSAYQIKLGN